MIEINKKSTRAEVLAAVKEDGYALSRANTKFRDDKVIVMASIKWSPESIKYASDRIKKDKKIVLKTVSLNGNSLKYVSKELKKNKDIVQAAYKSVGEDVLEYADKGIRKKIITAIRKKEQKNRLIAEKKRKKEEGKIKKDYKDVIKFIEKNAIKERNDIYKHLNINNLKKLLDKLIATHKNTISSYDLISCFCPKEINKKKFFRYMTDNLGSADFYHHSINIFDRDLDQADITLAEKLLILINSGLKFIPVFNFKNYFFIDHYQKYIKKNKKYLFKIAIEMDYVEPKYDKGAISYNINDYNEDEIDAVIENFLSYLSDAGEGYCPGNYYFRLLSIKDKQYLIFISEEYTGKNFYHEIRVVDSSSNYTKTELRKLIVSTINNYDVPHGEQIPKIKASEIDLNVLFDIDHYFRNDTGEDLYVEDNLSD